MVKVERSVVIQRPVNDVFAYVSDLRNEPAYHTDVLTATQTSKGPVGVGSTYEFKTKPFGGMDRATTQVTSFVPGQSIGFETVMGKVRAQRSFRVDATPGGTKVTYHVELRPPGLMVLMSFMMRRMIGKSWDRFLTNLKKELER